MEGIFGLVKGGSYLFDLVLGVLGTLLSVLLTYLFYTRQRRMINIRKAERNRQKE
jgi:hypothetical protein